MTEVRQTKNGIRHLHRVLREKKTVVTRAHFWGIPHDSGREDIRLKLGRYRRGRAGTTFAEDVPEIENPKSELTLDDEEFRALVDFISENYQPLKDGATKYIPLASDLTDEDTANLKALFSDPDRRRLVDLVVESDVLPEEFIADVETQRRRAAVRELESMLEQDLAEPKWQRWLTENDWILGTEFVRVIDERPIDTKHIADYLMEAYDGFLDIVEIKRPGGTFKFWASSKDRGNYCPSSDLSNAIMQAARYIVEVEREANSVKFLERVGFVKTIKPRCILVFGRSRDWDDEQREAYRILNSSFHNLTILTYDHVLTRAKRMVGLDGRTSYEDEDIPIPW